MDKYAIIFSFYKCWINKLGDMSPLSLISNIIDEYDKIVDKNEPVDHPHYIRNIYITLKVISNDMLKCRCPQKMFRRIQKP